MKHEFNRNEFDWAEEFYDVIKVKLNLPDWFGKNADALWDILTGYIELPCEFVFVGFNKRENEYNHKKLELIKQCFIDAEKLHPNKFKITFIDQD